jgi:Flp pilus assembly protein TadD
LTACLRSLELRDGNAPAHNTVGLIYLERGNLAGASSHFRAALKFSPQFPQALNNLGVVWERSGKAEEAKQQYRKALEADPDCAAARGNLDRLEKGEGTPGAEKAVG